MKIEDGFATEKRSASPTSPSSTQVQAKGTANPGLIAAVIGGVIVAATLGFLGGMQVNSRSASSQSGPGGHSMMGGGQTSQGNMSPPGQTGQSASSGAQLSAPSNGANTTTQNQQSTTQQTTQDTTKNT
jgi:hypothetical protein